MMSNSSLLQTSIGGGIVTREGCLNRRYMRYEYSYQPGARPLSLNSFPFPLKTGTRPLVHAVPIYGPKDAGGLHLLGRSTGPKA